MHKMVNGEQVELSPEEEAEILAEWAANDKKKADYERDYGYQDKRRAEYPSIEDQLDKIYNQGLEAWKLDIKVVKDKYPKPVAEEVLVK